MTDNNHNAWSLHTPPNLSHNVETLASSMILNEITEAHAKTFGIFVLHILLFARGQMNFKIGKKKKRYTRCNISKAANQF